MDEFFRSITCILPSLDSYQSTKIQIKCFFFFLSEVCQRVNYSTSHSMCDGLIGIVSNASSMLTNNWLVGKKTTKLLHTNILEYQSSTHIYSMFYELEVEIYRKSKYIKNHLLWNQCSPYDHYFNVLNYQHFNFIISSFLYIRNIFVIFF